MPCYSRSLSAINAAAPYLARTRVVNLALLVPALLVKRSR
jgi:hypothetical protein